MLFLERARQGDWHAVKALFTTLIGAAIDRIPTRSQFIRWYLNNSTTRLRFSTIAENEGILFFFGASWLAGAFMVLVSPMLIHQFEHLQPQVPHPVFSSLFFTIYCLSSIWFGSIAQRMTETRTSRLDGRQFMCFALFMLSVYALRKIAETESWPTATIAIALSTVLPIGLAAAFSAFSETIASALRERVRLLWGKGGRPIRRHEVRVTFPLIMRDPRQRRANVRVSGARIDDLL